MGERKPQLARRQRSPKRARRIALDDQQRRIGLARAIERRGGKAFEPVVGQLQARVLPGDKQPGRLAKRSERMGNRT